MNECRHIADLSKVDFGHIVLNTIHTRCVETEHHGRGKS